VKGASPPAEAVRPLQGNRRIGATADIVGGEPAQPCEWPWQVIFNPRRGVRCGGTLISPTWVLTAGHCVPDASDLGAPDWRTMGPVVAGAHAYGLTSEPTRVVFNVTWVARHPLYSASTSDYDYALLELAEEARPGDCVGFACLPLEEVKVGKDCFTTGWGLLHAFGPTAAVLQEALVNVIDSEDCKNNFGLFPEQVTEQMLCAQGTARDGRPRDACQGDSGGPLVCRNREGRYELHGVTSWGIGCGRSRYPGVWARVTKIVDWIANVTNTTLPEHPSIAQASKAVTAMPTTATVTIAETTGTPAVTTTAESTALGNQTRSGAEDLRGELLLTVTRDTAAAVGSFYRNSSCRNRVEAAIERSLAASIGAGGIYISPTDVRVIDIQVESRRRLLNDRFDFHRQQIALLCVFYALSLPEGMIFAALAESVMAVDTANFAKRTAQELQQADPSLAYVEVLAVARPAALQLWQKEPAVTTSSVLTPMAEEAVAGRDTRGGANAAVVTIVSGSAISLCMVATLLATACFSWCGHKWWCFHECHSAGDVARATNSKIEPSLRPWKNEPCKGDRDAHDRSLGCLIKNTSQDSIGSDSVESEILETRLSSAALPLRNLIGKAVPWELLLKHTHLYGSSSPSSCDAHRNPYCEHSSCRFTFEHGLPEEVEIPCGPPSQPTPMLISDLHPESCSVDFVGQLV